MHINNTTYVAFIDIDVNNIFIYVLSIHTYYVCIVKQHIYLYINKFVVCQYIKNLFVT